jgi:hypothetical protein
MKLKTNCPRWTDVRIYWINEICENEDEMIEKLLSGQEEYFKALQLRKDCEVKSNQSYKYEWARPRNKSR